MRQKLFGYIVVSALAALLPIAASAQVVRCESQDGRRHECRFAGFGVISLSQQLSRNNCVEGQTWGTNGNMIWVDRGCRADFVLTQPHGPGGPGQGGYRGPDGRPGDGRPGMDGRGPMGRPGTVVCESRDGRRNVCAAATLGAVVTLNRQISGNNCVQGKTWGYNRDTIWVDRGCRAEFAFTTGMPPPPPMRPRTIACESQNNRRVVCAADVRFGVDLVRQMSNNNCVQGRTWGYDRDGIWVDRGCRAEFAVRMR